MISTDNFGWEAMMLAAVGGRRVQVTSIAHPMERDTPRNTLTMPQHGTPMAMRVGSQSETEDVPAVSN